MKTVTISWTETSTHEVTVNVPDDFDADDVDSLADDLGSLDDDGFQGVEREGITVEDADYDPDAEEFC
jgi:hypothetical protein